MSELPAAIGLVGLAIVAFVGSIRLGILLGRGLDTVIEARRDAEAVPGETDEATETDETTEPGETSQPDEREGN
jgi:hypothetical protein